ncbi:MAG: tetratricopeptide repeat protein [Leptolyngbyaceae bacterium]|nr:tetratricopeptide repeat protein [Leptolyngbyaceae bacterium]
MLSEVIGGRYHIIRYLGGGGFGQTYLSEDQHLPGKPHCVVKKLLPRVNDAKSFEIARRLFNREAEVLYSLGNHDQIPQLFAHFEENREFYLVQQYIEGVVLSKELKSGRSFDENEVINLLVQILSTLSFVHEQNVIHRDIKPSNLIRRKGDNAIVMIDFGGVKQIGVNTASNSDASTVTVAIGSSGYMPNEQLAGKPRFSSDIYAVGMVGIQTLTGCSPSHLPEDLRTGEILWRDRAPHVSDAFADVLNKMTRYDYRQRYQSTQDVLTALRNLPGEVVSSATIIEISRRHQESGSLSGTNSLSLNVPLEDPAQTDTHTSSSVSDPPSVPSWTSNDSADEINGYLAWYERADELFQQQRFRKAAESYGKVLKVIPEDYMVWFKLAMALENCHQLSEAVDAYTHVTQIKEDDYLAWYRRGKNLEQLRQFEEAIASYDRVIELQPENYWVLHDKGKSLEALKQFPEALAAYDRAVQIKSDFQLAIDSRRQLLQEMKQVDRLYHLEHYDEAIASCDRLLQQTPDDPTAWLMRGMALENSNHYKEAVKSYNRVLKIQPNDHLAWFKRGALLEKLGMYLEAAKSYSQVAKLQPENCWAWNDYGRVLETIHHYQDALSAYDKAIRLRADVTSAIEGRNRVIRQLELSKHPGKSGKHKASQADALPRKETKV